MCLFPRFIQNKKYTETKKNGGVIPPVLDSRVLYVPIGCNRCMECRKQKAREWSVRLAEEVKSARNGKFVTFTFSNESYKRLWEDTAAELRGYEKDNAIATLGVRRFLERWRKEHKVSVRHWLITELGGKGTENIHLHGIIWTEQKMEVIAKAWGYGFMYDSAYKGNYVDGSTVTYITKYIQKIDEKHKLYMPKILTSAGIGRGFTDKPRATENKYKGADTNEGYRTDKGHKLALPIYYRNKLYSDEERERLWLNKLDKGERWIGGMKIKADDHESYSGLIKFFRERNKKLGYGGYITPEEQARYEIERRELLQRQRIAPSAGLLPEGG